MAETVHVIGLREFKLLLKRHLRKRKRAWDSAVRKAAHKGVAVIRKRTPKAFGELRESIHVDDGRAEVIDLESGEVFKVKTGDPVKIVIDAPHAAAVEIGSRPHYVPLEELVAWVRLRNLQGTYAGRLRRQSAARIGPTTVRQALTVRGRIKTLTRRGRGMSEEEAIYEVAKSIQTAILDHGTKPHFYVRESLSELKSQLDDLMKRATEKSVGT